MRRTASRPQLLTVAQAAAMLRVSDKTIRRWIEADRIPYLRLPGGGYRIPQGALLASLQGNYRLDEELVELDRRLADVSEDEVLRALDDVDE